MLRKATFDDITTISELWQESFGDPSSYVNFYFQHKFQPDFTVLLEIDEKVIGMAHLLPCTLHPDKKALYWYAVCIAKEMRGKGYFRSLVTKLLSETQKRGYANLCVPVKGLSPVYQKLGFGYAYYGKDIEFIGNTENNATDTIRITKATVQDYLDLPKEQGSTLWNLDAVRYAYLENELTGGQQLLVKFQNKEYFFFAIKKENHYLIDYHNMNVDIWNKIKDNVFLYLNCERIVFREYSGKNIIGLSDSELVNENSRVTLTLG